MGRLVPAIPLLVPALIDVACNSGPSKREKALQQLDEILTTRGVWGEQELVSLETLRNPQAKGSLEGSLSGGFFLFSGGVSGDIKGKYSAETITTIQFAWKTTPPNKEDAMLVLSELPASKTLWQEMKDPEAIPTVKFELDKNALLKGPYYAPTPTDTMHPEGFLKAEGALKAAIFHLPSNLYREIFSPPQKK